MARKLTDEERANLEFLRDAMSEGVEPSLKNSIAAVASSLVRIQADVVTQADVSRILRRRGEQRPALEAAMMAHALDPVPGKEGVWTLRVPKHASNADEPAEGAAEEPLATDEPQAEAAQPEAQQSAGEEAQSAQGKQAAPVTKPRTRRRRHAANKAEGSEKPAAAALPAKEPTAGALPAAEAVAALPAQTEASSEPATVQAAPVDVTQVDAVSAEAVTDESRVAEGAAESAASEGAEAAAIAELVPVPASDADQPGDVASEPAKSAEAPDQLVHGRKLHVRGRRRGRQGKANGQDKQGEAGAEQAAPAGPSRLSDVPYVRRATPDEDELRTKILKLDQRFWINGWLLSHPGAYALYQHEIEGMNDALTEDGLPGDITRRQLAYRMGGDEKFFEYGSDGHKLLRAMGMDDVIRHRPMPKADLLYFAPRRRKHMRVLVTENLDPWLDVHDRMYEDGRSTVLGERVHAVVLGGGTPVLERNRLALLLDTLGAESVEVLYWGDIDRAGVDLLVRLREVLGEKYPFKPFTPAYQLMVDRARERYPEPLDNEQTGQVNLDMPDMGMLCAGLSEEDAAYARAVVEGCRLVPQEILTRRDL